MRKEIERFIENLASNGSYSQGTMKAYRYELERFLGFVGDRPAGKMGEIDVRMYLMRLAKGCGPAAQRRALAVLKRFFQWLVVSKRIQENPLANIDGPALMRESPRRLETRDIDLLLDAVDEIAFPARRARDLALIGLMLHAGIRLSELVDMNRRDVDLATGNVIVASGKSARQVPLNSPVRGILSRHLASVPDREDEPLFRNSKGERLSKDGVYYLVTRYLRAAGILDEKAKASPKSLRHTFCSRLLAKGVAAAVVAELAGCTSPSSLAIYSQVGTMDKKNAVELLGDG